MPAVSLMIAFLFSGTGLGLILSKGLIWTGLLAFDTTRKPPVDLQTSESPGAPYIDGSTYMHGGLLELEPLTSTDKSKPVKCNCGLELPEESIAEHTQATGHSKPFTMGSVRVGKIWDLEEAVIETASPQCSKCGKPVLGLKRIGKTIYVRHLGCSRKKGPGQSRKTRQHKKSSAGLAHSRNARRLVTARMCSTCWRPINKHSGFMEVASVNGRTLWFHERCLSLQSG